MTCSDLFTTWSLYVYDLFLTCSLHVDYLFTTCSLHVYDLFTTCLWIVYELFKICSLHVQQSYIKCNNSCVKLSFPSWFYLFSITFFLAVGGQIENAKTKSQDFLSKINLDQYLIRLWIYEVTQICNLDNEFRLWLRIFQTLIFDALSKSFL